MKYLLLIFTICMPVMEVVSRFETEPSILSITNAECEPINSLYTDDEDGSDDRSALLKEASALSYCVGEETDTTATQVANKVMHSINVAAALAGTLKFALKIAPSFALLGAVFSVIAEEGFPDENEVAIEDLKKTMHAGFKALRSDMDRKFNQVRYYVDASIQDSEMKNLQSELEILSQVLFNCVHERDEKYTRECNRNAIRVIAANEFRFSKVYFKDTDDEEIKMKNYELSLTLYRKYIIISTLAHVTALKMLRNRRIEGVSNPDDQDFERLKLETSLKEGLTQFEEFAKDITKKMLNSLWDGLPFMSRCKRTGEVTTQANGFTLKVKLTSSQKSFCVYKLNKVGRNGGTPAEMCDYLHKWYQQSSRADKVYYKVKKYWADNLMKPLFGTTGILKKIREMAENHKIDESITEELKAEYSKDKYQSRSKKAKKAKKQLEEK